MVKNILVILEEANLKPESGNEQPAIRVNYMFNKYIFG